MKSYEAYYTPTGHYRKYLMQQENLSIGDIIDCTSRLRVRIGQFLKVPEIREATNTKLIELAAAAQEMLTEVTAREPIFMKAQKEPFCDAYEKFSSIIESMEEAAYITIAVVYGEGMSEDAKLLQKRTHGDKEPVKDPIKVGQAKAAWKRNAIKYKSAIRKFHKSTAGKQFHRNLNRFNKMRTREEAERFSENDILDICKGVSSLITHLLIEIQGCAAKRTETVTAQHEHDEVALFGLYNLFSMLLEGLVSAYYLKDKAAVAEALEVIGEYYSTAGEVYA